MSSAAPVRYERIGSASVLTIDRPERRNAVDGQTAELLRHGFRRFEEDAEARVLVVTGTEPAFCAGADLKALETLEPEHPDGPMGFTRLAATKPTIAAISGWCLAGGLELAIWCDLRIATEGSTFGLFERRWGVPLIDGGTQKLPRLIGFGRALELIILGRAVEADEALRIGLFNEVVPPGRHLERALELAERIASFPRETMLSDRHATIEGVGLTFEEGMRMELEAAAGVQEVARRGAARFAGGEGRHGKGA
jgi:enoyl-CoA hydratase/carnithine racemase